MAPTRADKEARDPVSAPAEETILVAQDQLPQARAEDLAKKEEAGDNKMTSDPQPGSGLGPALRPDLMEQLTVSDPQEAARDSMLDPHLDLHQPLHPQDPLDLTTDQMVTDSPTTTTLEEAMVKIKSTDHQKQDQATIGPLALEAIPIIDLLDLEVIPTIDHLDSEETTTIDLMDLEAIPTTDPMDLEEIPTIGPQDLEDIPTTDPQDLEEIPTVDPLDLEEIPIIDLLDLEVIQTIDLLDLEVIQTIDLLDLEEIPTIDLMDLEMIPTIDHLDLEEISMKGQEIQTITDQLTLADLLALQIGPLG